MGPQGKTLQTVCLAHLRGLQRQERPFSQQALASVEVLRTRGEVPACS